MGDIISFTPQPRIANTMKKSIIATVVLSGLLLTGCTSTPAPAPTVTVTETQSASPAPTVTVTPSPEQTLPDVLNRTRAGQGAMTDAEFTKFIRDARPAMATLTTSELIGLVDSACNAFDRGATRDQILNAVASNLTDPEVAKAIGFTIGAGVRIYCPEHVTGVEGPKS